MSALPRIRAVKRKAKSLPFRAFVAEVAARAKTGTRPDGEHSTSDGANPSSTSSVPQAKQEHHVKWIRRTGFRGTPVHVPILPLLTDASTESSTRKHQNSPSQKRRPHADVSGPVDVDRLSDGSDIFPQPPAYVQKEDKLVPAAREAHVPKFAHVSKDRPKPAASERAAQTSSGD